ncbi:MAG: hydroxymethylbilane synthase, partial [Proteobacteria bacterium]|nr:hydroxymethylbilane synthase [Pseudomonadota bacterium]
AGLKRLGLAGEITEALDDARFLPAVGQGAICLVARAEDTRTLEAIARFAHAPTQVELKAERAFLKVLDGSCRTPIGGSARFKDGRITFRGLVLSPDGTITFEASGEAPEAEAAALGERLGREIKAKLPEGFLSTPPAKA